MFGDIEFENLKCVPVGFLWNFPNIECENFFLTLLKNVPVQKISYFIGNNVMFKLKEVKPMEETKSNYFTNKIKTLPYFYVARKFNQISGSFK